MSSSVGKAKRACTNGKAAQSAEPARAAPSKWIIAQIESNCIQGIDTAKRLIYAQMPKVLAFIIMEYVGESRTEFAGQLVAGAISGEYRTRPSEEFDDFIMALHLDATDAGLRFMMWIIRGNAVSPTATEYLDYKRVFGLFKRDAMRGYIGHVYASSAYWVHPNIYGDMADQLTWQIKRAFDARIIGSLRVL